MRRVVLAVLLAAAVPAVAQVPLPAESTAGMAPRGNPMFAGMSEPGRAIMRAANKAADARTGREATGAARDRMLAILDADRLDIFALRRAMDDERDAAMAAKVRQQNAMIVGFQQLSLPDRRIFVANARAIRARMEARQAGQGVRPAGQGMPPPY